MATRKRHPIPVGLEPYCRLLDSCHDKGLVVELAWDRTGWNLLIRGGDTRVECESIKRFPECLNSLATAAIVRLGRR